MNQERLLMIIKAPLVSEKTARLQGAANQYTFEVDRSATKEEVKGAVEHLFSVKVESVRIMNVKGKTKAFRNRMGQRQDWRKAYVRLLAGQSIDAGTSA